MTTNQGNDSPAESKGDNIRNITVFGNYNENIEGDYNQNREVILKRNFIARSPYKGLKRFNAKDKDLFFGRERLIKKLIAAVQQSNLVLVLGASGSGKSSVVRAGVIPQIENLSATAYQSCLFTPNRDPFVSFHRSLLDPEKDIFKESEVEFVLEGNSDTFAKTVDLLKSKNSQWLIFVDQFEELFTSCSNTETRRNFIQGIVDLAQDKNQSVKLILAMRSDFLEELGAYPKFSEIAEKNINLVADMQTEELCQAIEQPAAKHVVVFESGLVESIIRDVQGQAGSLPLLQYTLDLLWQESDFTERILKSETYHQLGGVSGALQKHVNQIYQDLSPEQQLATKQILLRLVDVVALEQSEILRTAVSRRAYKSEFTDTQAETVQLLVDQNLLVSDDEDKKGQATVEIAHEALLTSWAELKDWISDARNTISLNNRLAEDAARWQDLKEENQEQANEELWTGSKLEKAIELRKDGTFDVVLGGLSDLVNEFIDASIEWREQKIQQELAAARKIAEADRKARIEAEKREKEQKKANKKLRIWSLIAVTFSITASILGVSSYFNSQEAQLKRQAADIKVKLSIDNEIEHFLESIELVGENKKFNRKSLEKRTKLEPEVQSVLLEAVQSSNEKYTFNAHQDVVYSVDFSLDGKYLVSSSADRTVKLWDVDNRSLVHTFDDHQDDVFSVDFSPDGKYLVSGSDDRTVKLWDIKNLYLVHTFNAHQDSVVSVKFSSNGKYFASCSGDRTVKLWDVDNRSLVHIFNAHQDAVYSIDFSPDGKYLVSSSADRTVKLWDVDNRSLVHTFNAHQDAVISVKFSPDGHYLISGSDDRTVKLWDIANQSLVHTFNSHQDSVYSVDCSPDSKYLISGSRDRTVKLWDIANQSLVHTFNSHQGSVYSIDFGPDSKYLISGSGDETIKLWDIEDVSLVHTFNSHQDWVFSIDLSSDSKYLISGSFDKTVKLWDIENLSLDHTFSSHQDWVFSVDLSSDGKYLVSGSRDKTIKLWNINNKSLVHTFNNHQDWVFSVDLSSDGKYLVSGSSDRTVKLWDIENRSLVHTFNAHQEAVRTVKFSRDGKYLASGSRDKTIKLWNINNKSLVHTFNNHQDAVYYVDFSPDGKYLASGSRDKTIKLWDTKNRSLVHTFNAHQDAVTSVEFSPNGKYLVSGSRDKTIKLWDIKNQSLVHTFNAHQDVVTSVEFSPNGKYIVSSSGDRMVKLWQGINWQDWMEIGCKRIRLHPALASSEIESAPGAAKTCLRYGRWSDSEKAQFFVKQGLAIAKESGDVNLAKRKFRQASKLDSTNVNLEELETEANQLAAQFEESKQE